MGEVQDNPVAASLPPESLPPPASIDEPPFVQIDDTVPPPSETPAVEPPRPRFDPSRMIGIIRRKALMKELAAVYHAEALAYGQELLELQKKYEEPYIDIKIPDEPRKEAMRPSKRPKKTR